MNDPLYDAAFYEKRRARTSPAARQILSIVADAVPMNSVIDVGCGTGTWLAAALELGAKSAHGIEGDWVTADMLDDKRIALHNQTLENAVVGPRVDLAMSLEVAEHLSDDRADSFIADLTQLAPAVLFSAAIPGQGGVNHINEQWQSYWAEKFLLRDYYAVDLLRFQIWHNDEIPMWYRQNIILYLSSSQLEASDLQPANDIKNLDIVHPLFWERANRELRHANARPESEYLNKD